MCSVVLETVFGREPRKALEWAMRKKGIPVMSLYEGANIRVRFVRGVWG